MRQHPWYYIYILVSLKDGFFYIGMSPILVTRLQQHARGEALATKNRRPFKLLYYEAHRSKYDARRREKYFKTTKGKITLRQICRDAILQKPN